MRFTEALLAAELPVVMEVKVRTGSGSPLLGDRDPAALVARYERAGAPCVSVVTGKWFGGTPQLLRTVSASTGLPLLRKDFIVRESDLDDSLAWGADAVLITASVLPAGALDGLVTGALRRGLTPFVEVTTAAEVAAVPHADECVVAVNNKDIGDRERGSADLGRSRELLAAVLATGTPCPVSASGLDDPVAAAGLVADGYAGLLVGTGVLRADVDGWVAAFRAARGPAGAFLHGEPGTVPGSFEPGR
ncbi:hypothetical protein L6E12_25730 [Actinokineospora sp. PR83]|uniref:hypothetical protein n=1 Tax=Actinokineospora sp. PR83 TaxID=2884908 RepID=UPI0027E0E520|nr:hypothetical protein [Actinokineospora sp. PR83]MCG8919185.1 hypothetical protein [Actinokineospora sp. PR83]